ncbi:MAG TPA: extracellular solute-binding protein [Candidatus Thermoplasmatota archaeon]|nr:extracellular solute-binding protein [Candidatus Thermoplasmatota archaeon]
MLGIERWRQKTYGVPYWAEPFAIYYNKTLFRQKGIEDPWTRTRNQGDWTLEEMVEAARRINDPANDVWGLDWSTTSLTGIGPLVWTHGVSHLQYDPQVEVNLQLPQYVQAVTWAIDWMMRQKLNVRAPTPEAAGSRERIQGGQPAIDRGGTNLFAQGKIGVHWRSVNDWRRMWPIVGTAFEWDMLPVPQQTGKPGASWSAGHPVCAYAKTKHPDDAWAFMRWLMQDEFQGYLAEHQYLVPAKKRHQPEFFRVPSQYPYQHPQVFAAPRARTATQPGHRRRRRREPLQGHPLAHPAEVGAAAPQGRRRGAYRGRSSTCCSSSLRAFMNDGVGSASFFHILSTAGPRTALNSGIL